MRWVRAAILVAGLLACQLVLFGPSLLGVKILLPLDLLAMPGVYLPATPEYQGIVPQDFVLSDLVYAGEPAWCFAARELRAGRLPLWNPYGYCGAPFARFQYLSPFFLLYCCFPHPVMIAWVQVAKAIVAGVGAYLFFRRVLQVGLGAALIGAWCFPLTPFFVFWQGFPLPFVTAWLPWLLLAVDRAVRRPRGWGGPALALVTALVLISGQLDLSAQVLLTSGLYALWCLFDEYGRAALSQRAMASAVVPATAWGLGLVLAAPNILPLLDYTRTGSRLIRRAGGAEERPPVGLRALPQVVLPYIYGSTQSGWRYLAAGNLPESASTGYAGLLAALWLAPLGLCSRPHRSQSAFWLGAGFLGLSWVLNVPVLVSVWRLPVLNMLSHNRFVFVSAFAVLTLAVIGLDLLWRGDQRPRPWFLVGAVLAAAIGAWCAWRAADPLPWFAPGLRPGASVPNQEVVRYHFRWYFAGAATLCAVTCAGWLTTWGVKGPAPWIAVAAGAVMLVDLVWTGYGYSPQCDPKLYYPPVAALDQLKAAPPGRVLGVHCLPSNLNEMCGLRDIRGYDGVDPAALVAVLEIARDRRFSSPDYAVTQWYVPRLALDPGGKTLMVPPVLSLLNVRYLIFRRSPAPVTAFIQQDDYWIVENPQALPRAFIPRAVRMENDPRRVLAALAAPDFDPARLAFTDMPVRLPQECRGSAEIVAEVPGEVTVIADMETPGLLVLADLWTSGWAASVNGHPLPVLRVNHAVRGVELPAGRSTVVFRYEPLEVFAGLRLGAAGLVVLAAWSAWLLRRSRAKAS
jgi:hypothetical protein